jgi:hypothetical protein
MRGKSFQATTHVNAFISLMHAFHRQKRAENCRKMQCEKATSEPQRFRYVYKVKMAKRHTKNQHIHSLSGVSRKHIKKLIGCKFIRNMRGTSRSETGNYAELNEISLKFYADFHNMQKVFLCGCH